VPVRPQRGQVLVTERLAPFLPLPASGLRQTGEGTVMIGATQEEAGFDVSTTGDAAARLSRKTVDIVPALWPASKPGAAMGGASGS
jgi:glycine/D-amino acid oxidase-like deaminating enzyme